MKTETKKQYVVIPSFLELLTLLFIGLKLTGYITWSWWWVLSPTLIPIGIFLGILLIWLVLVGLEKTFG